MNSTLGERIKLRREQLGMTQEDLAAAVGSDHKKVWEYETNKRLPRADSLAAVADALNTTIDYLMGKTEYAERPLRGEGDLRPDEIKLIKIYRGKAGGAQERILQIAEIMA